MNKDYVEYKVLKALKDQISKAGIDINDIHRIVKLIAPNGAILIRIETKLDALIQALKNKGII